MTPKERLEKILSERKNPLLIENKVTRIIPKSEDLFRLECASLGLNRVNFEEYMPMIECYTGRNIK